ncbi:MFS transporter [Oerskovia sp. Sa1BUA8]|uniref:MFS transporter n=1 Tax=Oerskovia douganii TaxID=2762210 RepID=A0A9D5UEV1_9CELL|nr:MFS transporter [Oerskovia douganii]MBE7699312.1 MFS transporter [Oerskovia douganii]
MSRIVSKATPDAGIESIRPVLDPGLSRARWSLLGIFLLNGIAMSSWLARIPSIRDALGMTPKDLGFVLLAGAVGALLTVTLAGPVVNRFGGKVTMLASTAFFAAAFVLLGVGPATGSVALLAAGIFLNGVAFSLANVPMNVESASVERRTGRTILPQFHAAFSVGAVVGSLVGAACAAGDVPVLVQFAGTAVVATVWRLVSIPMFIHATPPRPRVEGHLGEATVEGVEAAAVLHPRSRRVRLGAALSAWREPRTLLIGLVIMAAALSEGSANDWLSLAVVDGFEQTEAVGAVVFGAFVGAMTVMRLLGTRLIDRYGRVAVLRVSGVASIGGLLLFGFAPNLPLAGVGVLAWGMGAALAVPIGIAAASDEPLQAASRVSVVSAFSSMASLAAPPLLGIAAEAMGARHALVLIVVAMVVSVLLSAKVAPLAAAPVARPLPDGGAPAGAAGRVVRTVGEGDGAPGVQHEEADRLVSNQPVPSSVRTRRRRSARRRTADTAPPVLPAPTSSTSHRREETSA